MAKRESESEAMDEELVGAGRSAGRRAAARRARRKGPQPRGHRGPDPDPAAPPRQHRNRRLGQFPGTDLHDRLRQKLCWAVGLDRTEIGNQLREEMGGQRFASASADVFEAADPARTMPKWLVFGAIVAVIVLIVLMSWLNGRSLEQNDEPAANRRRRRRRSRRPSRRLRRRHRVAQGPVVLTATEPVWIQVTEGRGDAVRGASAGPDLRGAGKRGCAGAQDRQARSAADHGRHRGCAAGWPPAGDGRERQPAARRSLSAAGARRSRHRRTAAAGAAGRAAPPTAPPRRATIPIHRRESRAGAQ